jgi:hypothetical protein
VVGHKEKAGVPGTAREMLLEGLMILRNRGV